MVWGCIFTTILIVFHLHDWERSFQARFAIATNAHAQAVHFPSDVAVAQRVSDSPSDVARAQRLSDNEGVNKT